VASLREAVRLAPALADAHLQLARALEAQGASVEARRHLEEARRLAPWLVAAATSSGRAPARA
jgi:Flp pilus assembly protein TadD